MLKGYKTYLVAFLLIVVEGLHANGQISDEIYQLLRNLLGAGAVATVAAKINRMNAKLLLLLPLLFIANTVNAQTTQTLAYDYNALPTEVSTYTQTITIDSTILATVPTCIASPNNRTACSVPIPTLSAGSHTISIIASKSGMSSELKVTGLNPTNAPKSPENTTIKISIVINLP